LNFSKKPSGHEVDQGFAEALPQRATTQAHYTWGKALPCVPCIARLNGGLWALRRRVPVSGEGRRQR
jgi:hypothetical protein